ncbi:MULTISPECIES: AAA family ATPase [Pseudomonas syringae group]|uniref:AAA family ATPase n=1 Tax=Pseudomonas asturiensis TaxID=1190415 RepID=A0ABX6HE79_9PSED|nr:MULTISPECIES: AAA family ATPase [Pseudomonas syringae group]QHF03877.1 AAA family ATPase [Pseudomonas asturiensis]QXG39135.1 ATP-binding protein [Pseudomonas viridiflava]
MLENKESIDERHIFAQKIYSGFQKENVIDDSILLTTVSLYLIASLILDAKSSRSEDGEIILTKRDTHQVVERMSALLRDNDPDSASRLLESFDLVTIGSLLSTFSILDNRAVRKKGFALFLFDFIFEIHLTHYDISLDHSRIVATLANSLTKDLASIVEAFPYSGEIGVTSQFLKRNRPLYHWEDFGFPFLFQGLVTLRMMLHRLDSEAYIYNQLVDDTHNNLTLVDCPVKIIGFKKSYTSSDALLELIELDELTNLTLAIFDSKQCSNAPDKLIEKIINGDLLEAVIDFCSVDHNGNKLNLTAWIMNKNKTHGRETLFVDVRPLTDSGCYRAVWFASAVIERWRNYRFKFKSNEYTKHFDDRLKKLFSRYLEDEFRELPGFVITRETKSLIDEKELTTDRAIKRRTNKSDLFALEYVDLSKRISDSANPACIYIIGDNGAGKSILLKSIITTLNAHKIDSVGIAFSATDRFPIENDLSSLFNYQGVKNISSNDINCPQSTLAEHLMEIHSDPSKLAFFRTALKSLNFSHRLFIIPAEDPENPVSEWERMLATVELDGDFFNSTPHTNFEPGLQHHEDGAIISFSSLSSGEQQLLSLIIKICAHAENHTTFLIDEPEISMHVRWQQQIPQLLASISDEFECSFVVATHSPLIIANTRTEDICYLAKNKVLTTIQPYQRHSVEAILLDGFNAYTPDSREITDRCAVIVSRAIQITNAPGKLDTAQKSKLKKQLTKLKRNLSTSTSDKSSDSFKKDLALIAHAQKAIMELFNLAEKRSTAHD